MPPSYSYPTKLAVVPADAVTMGTALAQRQSDVGTTNGGIQASGGAAAVPQLGVDTPGQGLAYETAIADVILAATGYQGQDDQLCTNWAGTNSGTFVDATGIPTWSFTPALAKTYLLHVDLKVYFSSLTGNGQATFRVLVGATAYDCKTAFVHGGTTGIHLHVSFRIPVAFAAGASTIKLQVKTDSINTTVATNTTDARTLTVTG